jgi:T-complex protein 1 subunit beta
MNLGEIGSMRKLGITESYKLKRQVVSSASEAAEMILRCVPFQAALDALDDSSADLRLPTCRVDNILRSAPRKREGQ